MSLDDAASSQQQGFLALSTRATSLGEGLEHRVGQLFDEHKDAVYTHIVLMLGNPTEAEELTQEVFLRLHRQLAEGKKIHDIKPWLFRVAQNLVVDRIRAIRPVDSLSEENVLAEAETNQAEATRNPEQALLHKERCEQVREAFSRLPARQRQCMHLKAEGFRYHEIAMVLGIARSSVIENVKRAMARLTEEFEEYV